METGKLKRLLDDPAVPALLRGEIWVDPQVLAEAGFASGPIGLIDFAAAMEADVCFIPWSEATAMEGRELAALAHGAGLDCALIVDGPFQRLATRRDLCALLAELAGHPKRFAAQLDREMDAVTALLDRLEGAEIDLVLLGEDVGYNGGLYFSPDIFRAHLLPRYETLHARFRSDGFAWGWHSDGRVEPLMPELLHCGFQFFSLEPECVDLLRLKKTHSARMCLIGGIRADWLAAGTIDRELEATCLREIGTLVREGGLVLSSTSGLYRPEFLANLKRLYRLFPPFRLADAAS